MLNTKNFLSCILLLLLAITQGHSQQFTEAEQYELDSLNSILDNPSSPDSSIVSSYLSLSEILYVSNIDTLKYLCETAIELGTIALKENEDEKSEKSLKEAIAGAYNNLAYWYQHVDGNNDIALEYYKNSLSQFEELGNKKGIAYAYENIGSIYDYQAKIELSLENHLKALKIREEINDKMGIANSLNNIAYANKKQGNIEDAKVFYTRSYALYEELNNRLGMANILNSLAFMEYNQGNYEEALKIHDESLTIRKEIGDQRGIAESYNNIGLVYYKMGDSQKELEFYQKAFKIQKEINNLRGLSYSYTNIGFVYFDLGQFEEAESNAKESLRIAKEIGYPENILKASNLLSAIYEKANKNKKALTMYKQYISMRDSIKNEDTQLATLKLQANYEYEKQKALDDAEHDKLLAIEEEKKEKQQIFTMATATVLGVVLVFLLFVFNRLKLTRKQNQLIEGQKTKVEKQRDIIKLAYKEIKDSITYAKRIQSAILPPARIVKEYLEDSFIFYFPKDVVAGDFYWMRHQDDKILFAAADCTGHGVPGAMVSVVCNNALNRSVREYELTDPGAVLNKTRDIVVREFEKSDDDVKDGMDIALCTLKGMELQYAGAYNPLWIIRNGAIHAYKADRHPIGKSKNKTPYTTHTIQLEKGDVIYIFTDGLVDQFGGPEGKKFKSQGLRKLLIDIHQKPMSEQRGLVLAKFEEWKGELEQVDDICLIGVRV